MLLTLNEGPLVFALNSDQVGHTSFTLSLREVEGGRGSRLQVAVVPVFEPTRGAGQGNCCERDKNVIRMVLSRPFE